MCIRDSEEGVYPAESVRGDAVVVPQVELLEEKFELPRREAEAGVRGEHGRELGPVATEGKRGGTRGRVSA